MKTILIISMVAMLALSARANKQVSIGADGVVDGVSGICGKMAKVNHNKNQYSDAEWTAFGITSEAPYIIKDGAVWRDMVQAEKDAVDAITKQEVTDAASADVDLDALFEAIAQASDKKMTKQEVIDAFKGAVDPKKAKKEKKNK